MGHRRMLLLNRNAVLQATGESREGGLRGYWLGSCFAVYNPVLLMKCFINEEFKNYRFETGTPTFMINCRPSIFSAGLLRARFARAGHWD